MRALARLFSRTPDYRDFVLLDASGVCLAFKRCATQPVNGHWVQITDVNLGWLGKPLPGKARIV